MKKEVIPAVLPRDIEDISNLVSRLNRFGNTIQIDICDGKLVPAQTWPYVKGVLPNFKDDFELPGWEDFDYELDLMIQNPELYIDNLKNIGASRAVLHSKSSDREGIITACQKLIKYDIEVGIGLENNNTDYTELLSELEKLEIPYYIQIMGIDIIGKQGEPFSDASFEFIQKIHSEYPDKTLQVDGAVNNDTIKELSDIYVTRFVVGSWLSGGNIKDKIQELKSLIY